MEKWYMKLPRYTYVGQIFFKNTGCRTKHSESYIYNICIHAMSLQHSLLKKEQYEN